MKCLKWILTVSLVVVLCLSSSFSVLAYTDYTEEPNYVYSRWGYSIKTPTAYEYKKTIALKNLVELGDYSITSPVDMFVKENGEFFVVDSELAAILIFDTNQQLVKVLKEFNTQGGDSLTLKSPQGVFVSKDDVFYIADTGNNRVVVSDREGNVSMLLEKPENILGTELNSFLPIKVVADSVGRISIVARNINSGIMQFTKEGIFIGYSGAPTVSIDPFTKLLRKFSTNAQKAQMQNFVPTEYNNIKIDNKNFIWGTISSLSLDSIVNVIYSNDLTGKVTPIKKLNTMGVDVLRRQGVYAPIGDLEFFDEASKIIDVGLGPNNIYSMLDSSKGRIFTYNNDGILLYVFGNKGTKKGNMQTPVAIDYVGNSIYVLDSGLCQVLIYEPTSYGKLLIDAEEYYGDGEYELANTKWKEVAERNSNFDFAYIGLGNAKYSVGEYEEAMDYYEYADDKDNYSKAKEKLRKQTSEKLFPIIFMSIALIILLYLTVIIAVKIRKYANGENSSRKGEED